jgi:hypothetical protein
MVAESERLLQGILDKLARDPTGILTDFDLHTTHHFGMKPSDSRAGQGQSGVRADSVMPIVSETAQNEELRQPQSTGHRSSPDVSRPILDYRTVSVKAWFNVFHWLTVF